MGSRTSADVGSSKDVSGFQNVFVSDFVCNYCDSSISLFLSVVIIYHIRSAGADQMPEAYRLLALDIKMDGAEKRIEKDIEEGEGASWQLLLVPGWLDANCPTAALLTQVAEICLQR